MKKLILFSALFFSGISLQAGEVFPTSDAIWNFRTSSDQALTIGLIGDTLINDTLYQKVAFLNDTFPSPKSIDLYIGEIRSDNQKVWLRTKIQDMYQQSILDKEILLYDFSKNKGDRITSCDYIVSVSSNVIFLHEVGGEIENEITDIIIDEKGRKHYIVKYFLGEREWIEGIGITSSFPFFHPKPMVGGDMDYPEIDLQCFKPNGKVEYQYNHPNSNCQSCFCKYQYTVMIEEEISGEVKIYADPDREGIRMETPERILPLQVDLYDLSGKLIHNCRISEKHSFIDLPTKQKGIYIYRISRLGKPLQSGKISIQ